MSEAETGNESIWCTLSVELRNKVPFGCLFGRTCKNIAKRKRKTSNLLLFNGWNASIFEVALGFLSVDSLTVFISKQAKLFLSLSFLRASELRVEDRSGILFENLLQKSLQLWLLIVKRNEIPELRYLDSWPYAKRAKENNKISEFSSSSRGERKNIQIDSH